MIYCIPETNYPTPELYTEELTYPDQNGFEWKVARINNGFILKYTGNPYFKDTTFECELKSGKYIRIKNTNCIFFKDSDFETFYELRNCLINGYTDDIWCTIEELLTERLEHDPGILESEMV